MNERKTAPHAGWVFPTLLSLLILFGAGSHVHGQSLDQPLSTSTPSGAKAQKVQVGFYLLNAGRLDLERSDLPLDFYLWVSYNGTSTPKFEFINSRDALIAQQTSQFTPSPNALFQNTTSFRVTGNFEQDLDMSHYPFEKHQITMVMEDTEEDLSVRQYIADPAGPVTDPEFRIIGWNIGECRVSVATHTYASSFGIVDAPVRDYSQVVLSLTVSRSRGIMFVKMFVPVVLFMIIAMMGLTFPIDNLNQKVSLTVASLFSSVAYHVNLAKSMPPVGYLTFVDRLMIGQYAVLFLTLVTAIFTFSAFRIGQPEMATTISWAGRILVPLAAISLYFFQLRDVFFS